MHTTIYLGASDDLNIVHQPSEGRGHLVDDAMEQELLSTVEHQSSPHHQDGAVHFTLGLVRRCQHSCLHTIKTFFLSKASQSQTECTWSRTFKGQQGSI